MTTATHGPAAAWAAAHRSLLVLFAIVATLAVAAAVTLTVLLATDDAVPVAPSPAPAPVDEACVLPGAMTVALAKPFC
ncbi:hypothetical protein GCM10027261_33660 [Geodermatophilus arenarius]|uniref:Uncharacterized protein n=1 Tax=Geodermatophilus arenarius TaxID=1137990 RepID=A0ABV9LR10_9ACTN